MTKRRAEDVFHCDSPLKICVRSLCKVDAQSESMSLAVAGIGNEQLTVSCRKRTLCSDEQELPEFERPRKKFTTGCDNRYVETRISGKCGVGCIKHAGHVHEENKLCAISCLNSSDRLSKKRTRDDCTELQNAPLQPDEGALPDDDLSPYNTFHFWRVPLPELDLSALQTGGDVGERSSQPDNDLSVLSETSVMET
ncbi:hypothetical protein GJAV_G00023080 [Gymnothorax javanicus]|nr:hypothetical protein GJAV_G00023080 [Gymnothorax javanicus]